MSQYFEHVLRLPHAFHGGTHSGRQLKIMWQGADTLFGIWLSFLRENLATFVALFVLLPLTLFLNWRLGALADPPGRDRRRADLVRVPPHARRAGPGRRPTIPRSPSRRAMRSATSC